MFSCNLLQGLAASLAYRPDMAIAPATAGAQPCVCSCCCCCWRCCCWAASFLPFFFVILQLEIFIFLSLFFFFNFFFTSLRWIACESSPRTSGEDVRSFAIVLVLRCILGMQCALFALFYARAHRALEQSLDNRKPFFVSASHICSAIKLKYIFIAMLFAMCRCIRISGDFRITVWFLTKFNTY